MEKISINQLIEILNGSTAEDLKLIRYYATDNELIVLVRYKTVDFKCVIDKLSLFEGKVSNISSVDGFILTYLSSPKPVIKIDSEEIEKANINISVSQVP